MTITHPIDSRPIVRSSSRSRPIVRSKLQLHLRTTERTKQRLSLDLMASLQLLEDSQNLKYDNFVY